MRKTFQKLTCGVLALACAVGCSATMTACETANPEVKMTLEFNGETYDLEYKLYRKTAPATVEHFLYLVDNDYYDGLCIHDYDSDRLYGGGYSVTASNATELIYKKYFETVASFEEKFPHSVWLDKEKNTPAYTLVGEFEDNDFRVESGAIKEQYGSLAMYYEDAGDLEISGYTPYQTSDKKGDMRKVDYEKNLTTSQFFISLSSEEKVTADYCTFATLTKDGKAELEDLLEAIEEYIDANYEEGEDDFTESVSMSLFTDDSTIGETTKTKSYDVPKSPIVIKNAKVTKY